MVSYGFENVLPLARPFRRATKASCRGRGHFVGLRKTRLPVLRMLFLMRKTLFA